MVKKYLLLMILLASITLISCSSNESINLETFATCLTENGAQLFGSQTCPHCQYQKEMFNDAFEHIDYIECSIDREKCSQEGIKYLPTWKFADDTEVSGVQEFKELSEKTGCALN